MASHTKGCGQDSASKLMYSIVQWRAGLGLKVCDPVHLDSGNRMFYRWQSDLQVIFQSAVGWCHLGLLKGESLFSIDYFLLVCSISRNLQFTSGSANRCTDNEYVLLHIYMYLYLWVCFGIYGRYVYVWVCRGI